MAEIIPINQKRRFTLDDARQVLPIVRRMTERAVRRYRMSRARLEGASFGPDECKRVEGELHAQIIEWRESVERLGCDCKGLWIVDFDAGNGYFCWKYPEEDISYFHEYDRGFSGRIPLAQDRASEGSRR